MSAERIYGCEKCLKFGFRLYNHDSKSVDWNRRNRKEYYGLIAKSVEGKANLRRAGFLVYDPGDFF